MGSLPSVRLPGGWSGLICAIGVVGSLVAGALGVGGLAAGWWPIPLGASLGLLAGGGVVATLGPGLRRRQRMEAARGALIDAAPEGIILHRGGQVLFGNLAIVRLLGHEDPGAIQDPARLAGQVSESERRRWLQHERDCLANPSEPRQLEIPVRRPDGKLLWLNAHSASVPWEEGPAVLSFFSDVSAARQAREALRASELSYRSLFETNRRVLENSPAGIILVDRDLRVIYENPGVKALLGLPAEGVTGSPGLPLDQIELFRDGPAGRALMRLPTGRRIRLEAERAAAGAGERLWMAVEGVPIHEDERFTGGVVLVTDITQRKRQEEALRQQERLLVGLAGVRQHLLSEADLETAIVRALGVLGRQSAVDHVLMFQNEPLVGDDLRLSLRYEWGAESVERAVGSPEFTNHSYVKSGFGRWAEELGAGRSIRVVAEEAPESERGFLEQRGIRSALAMPIFLGPAFWGFLGLVDRRIARRWSDAEEAILQAAAESLGQAIERAETEARLRASEERFHSMTGNIPGMVFQFLLRPDGSRSYPYVSELGLQVLGLDAAVLQADAEPMMSQMHPTDRIVFERLLRESARTMEPKRWEGRIFNKEGVQRWAAVMARPSRQPNGDLLWNGLLLDITRRKRMELELIAAQQANPSRSEALSRAATAREALERLNAEAEAAREALAAVPAAAWAGAAEWEARLNRATEAAARLLRETTPAVQPAPATDLPALLREVIGVTLRGTDVIYRTDVDADLEPLAGDLETVRPVIHDLLIITLQALPEGGRVHLRAENVRVGPGRGIAGLKPGHYVRVTLRDTGGRPEAFRPLSDTQAPAPSLAAVLETVTRQGGWLTFEPQAEGTTVTLYLRAAIGVPTTENPEAAKPRTWSDPAETRERAKG